MNIYTLKEGSVDSLSHFLPLFVTQNIGREGIYTLVATNGEGTDEQFAGLIQFDVHITENDDFQAELFYIYVVDVFRRQTAGLMLIQKAEGILLSQDVKIFVTKLPYDDKRQLLSDLSQNEIVSFLREAGFVERWEDAGEKQGFFKLIGR